MHPPMFKYGIFYIFPSLRQGELLVNIPHWVPLSRREKEGGKYEQLHRCGTGFDHTKFSVVFIRLLFWLFDNTYMAL